MRIAPCMRDRLVGLALGESLHVTLDAVRTVCWHNDNGGVVTGTLMVMLMLMLTH